MEILINNIDLILIGAVIIISAVIFARNGQIELLRKLILSLADGIDTAELYKRLPTTTKLLVSGKTVDKLVSESKNTGE